jgi:PHD/YefM family antitoxin component YafN of YafNO toxin-antitoxin module
MLTVHPQYIKDSNGQKSLVILPAKEFDTIMEELEELEDIKLYDEAKKQDNGERIPMDEAFKMIEAKRKKNK